MDITLLIQYGTQYQNIQSAHTLSIRYQIESNESHVLHESTQEKNSDCARAFDCMSSSSGPDYKESSLESQINLCT